MNKEELNNLINKLTMTKVNKEDILKLPEGTVYKVFNPYSKNWKKEIVGKNDIAHNKYAVHNLEYYLIGDESNE